MRGISGHLAICAVGAGIRRGAAGNEGLEYAESFDNRGDYQRDFHYSVPNLPITVDGPSNERTRLPRKEIEGDQGFGRSGEQTKWL